LILKPEVMDKIGISVLLDTRLPEDYFGATEGKGHIPSAMNLPAPWAFAPGGTFRDRGELKAMASGLIGPNPHKEIILYCEVGGFASTWWFILSEVLGYRDIRLYDGSFQEWSADPEAPVTRYRWQ
jgi:thiosulfate/3-mercaptopyruvate sulfurtransferase